MSLLVFALVVLLMAWALNKAHNFGLQTGRIAGWNEAYEKNGQKCDWTFSDTLDVWGAKKKPHA